MSEKQNSQMTNSSPFLPPVLEKIPQELREVPQWVAWMAASDPNKKKPDKVPVDAKTGKAGSTTRPETWTSFETAVAYYQKKLGTTHTIYTKAGGRNGPIAGVGFVLTEDSHIVGIDIDNCIDPQGHIAPLAQQTVERVGSYPQILTWMIEGGKDWQTNGLQVPDVVRSTTDEYFAAQDLLGQWIDEHCITESGQSATSSSLFADWKSYCETRGERPGSIVIFAENLTKRGFKKRRSSKANCYEGITLNPDRLSTAPLV